jgi:membrane protease YdiL (CAAX protease family)
MSTMMAKLIRSYPLAAYTVLAYILSLALGLGLYVSLLFGLIALFGPAVAAFVVSRVWRGRAGVSELWAATIRWRVHPGWYLAAVALPVAGAALGHLFFVLAGHEPLAVPGSVSPILFVLFFLVIGEEIGWRGFLLRGLLARQSPLAATLVVAVIWALWHSPLYFIPGMPNYGQQFLPFVLWVVPLSFLLTWLWLGTRSALLATIMHGSANLAASFVFPLTDAPALFLFSALGTAAIAVVLVLASARRWVTAQSSELDAIPSPVPAGS